MAEPTNNPFAMPDDSSTPEPTVSSAPIRDVLGGDEGKVVMPKDVVPDGFIPNVPVSTPVANIPPLETPMVAVPPVIEPKPFEVPVTLTPTPETAPVISVMPTEAEAKNTTVTKPLREIPLQEIKGFEAKVPNEIPSIIDTPVVAPQMKSASPDLGVELPNPARGGTTPTLSGTPLAETPAPLAPKKSAIRTLQSDIASTVRDNQLSIAQIAFAQKAKVDASGIELEETEHVSKKKVLFVGGSIILVLAGIFVLGYAIVSMMGVGDGSLFTDETAYPTLIATESQQELKTDGLSRVRLLEAITAFVNNTDASPLSARALIPTRTTTSTSSVAVPLTLEEFFTAIETRAPGRLVRTLGPDMTLGAVGKDAFIITESDSFENGFAGMLEWEFAMADDVPFITKQPTTDNLQPTAPTETDTSTSSVATIPTDTKATSTTASTTPEEPLIPAPAPVEPEPVWKDIVVKNFDARALTTARGDVILVYSFVRNNLLIITSRKETLAVILEILATPQFGE